MPKRGKGAGFAAAGAALLALGAFFWAASLVMASRAASPLPNPGGIELADGAGPVDWAHWHAVNPDVVGWIEVPGTSISQPVVQARAADPEFYLTHDVYGEWNCYGCPYLDAGCASGFDSWGATVLGHNITTPPAMFHDLERYHDPQFAASHEEIAVYTPAGTTRYRVVASRTIDGVLACKRVSFSNEKDYRQWRAATLAAAGAPDAADDPSAPLLTLCTCSYFAHPADERTLVYATPVTR